MNHNTIVHQSLIILVYFGRELQMKRGQSEDRLFLNEVFSRSKANLNRKRKFPFFGIDKSTYKRPSMGALIPVQIFAHRIDSMSRQVI